MITVYSKPDRMQCKMSYRALDAKGLSYQVIDVTESDAALEYVKQLGFLTAQVVVISEHDHWGGFRPDQIDRVATGGASDDETVGE